MTTADLVTRPSSMAGYHRQRAIAELQELVETATEIIDAVEREEQTNLEFVLASKFHHALFCLGQLSAAQIMERTRNV